jgi:hypothetical protein
MSKGMIFLGAVFVLFFLTSCASTETVTPKGFSGSAELFKINNAGTVIVKGYNKDQPIHWVFVECENIFRGCYMRCQGPANKCKSIAEKSDLEVTHIATKNTK